MPPRRAKTTAIALLVVSMVSVQVGAALAKQMFARVGAMGAVTLRVSYAALLLCLVLRPWRTRRSAAAWRGMLMYGLALGGMNALFYASLSFVPLGVAVAIALTGPLTVAVLESRRFADYLWIALAVVGLLALLPIDGGAVQGVGIGFALGSGVCWALYILAGRRAGTEHELQTTAVGMAIAAATVLPLGLANAGAKLFELELLPLALGAAVLSSAIPYSLEMLAMARLPAKTFGTLMSAEPVFGALSGMVFLGERLTGWQWLAIGAIMAASVGTTLTRGE